MGGEKHSPQSTKSPKQIQGLWEWCLHEDHLFTNRANFFMVAEAMLFAAFAALLARTSINKGSIIIIGVAGIIVTVVWVYTAAVQRQKTMNPIKKILRQAIPEYNEIASGRKGWSINIVLGIILPILIFGVWVALLFVNCFRGE